jgi:hypothetical protein
MSMRNAKAWLIVIIVTLLVLSGNGCSRSPHSKELAALDEAYHSGVLNKNEYEAKKAALEFQADQFQALDKALAGGVITQADYDAKKAQLIKNSSVLAALERAYRADIFTREEYLAKKAALLSPNASAPASASAAAPPSSAVASPVPIANAPQPVASVRSIAAQGHMKNIDPPQGGRIIYGQVEGQTTEAGAMGVVLRGLHDQFGERPQVGRLFQVRGTQSVAAFFSVGKPSQSGGQIAGLIIAAKATDDHVEAALVTDDATRFPKTLAPMMKTLVAAWHPLEAGHGAAAIPTGPKPLRQTWTQDHSASIGLPDGWKLVPSMSMMGTVVAAGPNGEAAELGTAFLAMDTNNPNVQRTMQVVRNGGLRNTSYAKAVYYPYGGDMAKTFVYLMQELRHRAALPQASYRFSSVTAGPASPQERCVRLAGTADMGDGKGAKELNGVFCTTPPNRAGSWMSMAYTTMAPVQVAATERPTLAAILQSFNIDMNVVRGQSARIAGPAIEQIHAIGRMAANQAAAAHERNDIQNSSVYKRWDDLDKRSQEFENYQLGFSVVSDVGNNVHGTFWNEDAAALVEGNPDKYEYVSAPNYWKGVDY